MTFSIFRLFLIGLLTPFTFTSSSSLYFFVQLAKRVAEDLSCRALKNWAQVVEISIHFRTKIQLKVEPPVVRVVRSYFANIRMLTPRVVILG